MLEIKNDVLPIAIAKINQMYPDIKVSVYLSSKVEESLDRSYNLIESKNSDEYLLFLDQNLSYGEMLDRIKRCVSTIVVKSEGGNIEDTGLVLNKYNELSSYLNESFVDITKRVEEEAAKLLADKSKTSEN